MKEYNSWKDYYTDAEGYYHAAIRGKENKKKFSNNLLYNIICMSMENFFISLMWFNKRVPEQHSLVGMLKELKDLYEIDENLLNQIRYINRFQNICSIDIFKQADPNISEVEEMVKTLQNVKSFCDDKLPELEPAFS